MKNRRIVLSNFSIGSNIYAVHEGRQLNHPFYECDCYTAAYIAHGSGTLKIGDSEDKVYEGDIFLINADTPYKFVPTKGLRRIDIYYCFFSFENRLSDLDDFREQFPALSDFFNGQEAYIHAADTENKEIRDIFIQMIAEQLSSLPGSEKALVGYWIVLLTKIFRNTKANDFERVYSRNRTVDEAIRFIHTNLYTKVSLDDLAAHLNVSPSYICRLFREHVGMSTSQFINMLRVDKVKDVLKNTDKHVNAVPEMFSCNSEYLRRVFKRETGMTMQEYHDKYHYKSNPSEIK